MDTKDSQQAFQRLKFWIDLAKWFIVSVVLVVVTTIINYGLKDRQAALAELKFYDNYVTELIVLNPSPVQKRMLAQYFACVTPSEKLRNQWKIYYDSIYQEYVDYITPLMEEETILRSACKSLQINPNASDTQTDELARMKTRLMEIRQLLYPQLIIPQTVETE